MLFYQDTAGLVLVRCLSISLLLYPEPPSGGADQALAYIQQLHQWLCKRSGQTPPKGLLGTAISYALNQWDRLLVYLEEPLPTPDNIPAENAIRPLVLGRKNWLCVPRRRSPDKDFAVLFCG